jgi:mannan endo-1,4-beta-mannosidase
MQRKHLILAALVLVAGAAVLLAISNWRDRGRAGFVQARNGRFVIDGKPFRFVGANVAVMYRDDDRAKMPETLRQAAQHGIKVVRVWASGEGGPNDVKPIGADFKDWPRTHSFRNKPDEWNEAEFVFLDQVLAEAAKNNLRVQLCLVNWWRDTGGISQYLRWAGINGADDDAHPFGLNLEKAMLFYSNETTRRLYRAHLEKVVTRRNSVTGTLYKDDPTIFGYELINEGQCLTGRWEERRAWINEMSTYLRALDPDHMVASGEWAYRSGGAAERREWLADNALPNIDYCDVHHYPKDDHDSFVDSPSALNEFIRNRVAAAYSLKKPLVFGEFGIGPEGYNGTSEIDWYRAYFDYVARNGAGGAIFWILTPDAQRGYGVTYSSPRDAQLLNEINGASHVFASLVNASPPPELTEPGQHLIPRQFAFTRASGDPAAQPKIVFREEDPNNKSILYRFTPNNVASGRFEKLGGGDGYVWGAGAGYFEYIVPARNDRRKVGTITVRAHIQPVLPTDAKKEWIHTRVTLFVDGKFMGARLIPWEDSKSPLIQEWKIDSWNVRWHASRGYPLTIRFAVTPDSDWLYGINISNWPEGYESHEATPVEVTVN